MLPDNSYKNINRALLVFYFLCFILVTTTAWNIAYHYEDIKQGKSSNPIAKYLVNQREEVKIKSKMTMLNQMMPSFLILVNTIKGQQPDTVQVYKTYADYYEQVVDYFPGLVDANAILGYCYYQLGDLSGSVDKYRLAAAFDPQFFWNNYNLGVIYLKNKQYKLAADSLQKALRSDPNQVLVSIYSSKIYQQIIASGTIDQSLVTNHLREGYENSQKALTLIFEHVKKGGQEASLEAFSSTLSLKIL